MDAQEYASVVAFLANQTHAIIHRSSSSRSNGTRPINEHLCAEQQGERGLRRPLEGRFARELTNTFQICNLGARCW